MNQIYKELVNHGFTIVYMIKYASVLVDEQPI